MSPTKPVCRLCGATGSLLIEKYSVNDCTLFECRSCGFVQIADKPSEGALEAAYGRQYFEHGKYVFDSSARAEEKRRMKWLAACGVKPGARVLDAGCAGGEFILAAKKKYRMWGLDISAHAVRQAKKLNPELESRIEQSLI
ncbi:MAG: hypothetical protein U9N45_06630, partial [Gemmatimonadota bacterium]|nr:hypothetical protein [Gemmatimonadota bacterium]